MSMALEVLSSNKTYIIQAKDLKSDGYITDLFSYGISNLLVGNDYLAPAIEVLESIELFFKDGALIALAGKGLAKLGDKELPFWRAIPVPPGSKVKIKSLLKPVYVGIMGLSYPFKGKYSLSKGARLRFEILNGWANIKDIIARRVPSSIVQTYEKIMDRISNSERSLQVKLQIQLQFLEKVSRHLQLVHEAVQRGAKLIRVRISGKEYEVWVEELGD